MKKAMSIFGSAVICLSLAFMSFAQDSTSVNDLVRAGVQNYQGENYKTAYDLFRRAMKIDPNHPEASTWYWKMKRERDVKNLQDKGPLRAAEEKKAEEKKDTARQEPAPQDTARQEAARQEAARLETIRVETARLEAARQELARLETARQQEMKARAVTGERQAAVAMKYDTRIGEMNRLVSSLLNNLKAERESRQRAEQEVRQRDPGTGVWRYVTHPLFMLLLALAAMAALFIILGLIWRRNRMKGIPSRPSHAEYSPRIIYEGGDRDALLLERRTIPLQIGRDYAVQAENALKTQGPRAQDDRIGAIIQGYTGRRSGDMPRSGELLTAEERATNDRVELCANGYLYLLEKKVHRGNDSLKCKALCTEIGVRMGLSQEEIRDLRLAALLKDIGFLFMPEEILFKKSGLSGDEMMEVLKHPDYSADIASTMSMPERVVTAVRQHHERYNATGYPHKIGGDAISLFGRVVGLCDSFIALTSRRPYRKELSQKEALKLLNGESYLFDPGILDILSDVVNNQHVLADSLKSS